MKRGHPDVTEGGISLPLLTLEMEQGSHKPRDVGHL